MSTSMKKEVLKRADVEQRSRGRDVSGSNDPAIDGPNDETLAISTVSAPCYFAVCMDAIALGRWFEAQQQQSNDETENAKLF